MYRIPYHQMNGKTDYVLCYPMHNKLFFNDSFFQFIIHVAMWNYYIVYYDAYLFILILELIDWFGKVFGHYMAEILPIRRKTRF